MNLFQEMEVNYRDFIGSANDFMESCKEFKFQENGYGKGFFEGQMRERKYWKDKIKAKMEEIKNECKYCKFTDEFCQELLQNNNCTQGNTFKVLQSLLGKE